MSQGYLKRVLLGAAALIVVGVLIWQGVTAAGNPDPTAQHLSPGAATLNTAILVFREGLEAILVLSAITAGLVRQKNDYWKPISIGAGLSFIATIITWFVVVGLIALAGSTTSELNIQAATGLLANVVLLVVMNWFFHNIYWAGWISLHNKRKKEILETAGNDSVTYRGLVILGLTAMYREGFEVVLFLQNIRLQVGSQVVLVGVAIGLALTLIVGLLTFLGHKRLPYKKMLVVTGVMLGVVLLVMTGETVQEMQLAGWIPTTEVAWNIPGWMGLWFAILPTVETLAAQAVAALLVIGSYVAAGLSKSRNSSRPINT